MPRRRKPIAPANDKDNVRHDERNTRRTETMELPRSGIRRNLLVETRREQSGPSPQEMQDVFSFQAAQPSSGDLITRPIVREPTVPGSLCLPYQAAAASVNSFGMPGQNRYQEDQHMWAPHFSWSPQPVSGGTFDGRFHNPYQSFIHGLPMVNNSFPAGNMLERDENRGRAAIMQSSPTQMPPRAGNASSTQESSVIFQWQNQSGTSQGSRGASVSSLLPPPPSIVVTATFSEFSCESGGYTSTAADAPPSQESCLHTWDARKNSNRVIPSRTKTHFRRKYTQPEKDYLRAFRKAGGACGHCKLSKKKCVHRDLETGALLDPRQPVSRSSNAFTTNNNRRQSSDSRTMVEEPISALLPCHSIDSSSYQRPTHPDLSVFTSSGSTVAPSDATSFVGDDTASDVHLHQHDDNFQIDVAGVGYQFPDQFAHDPSPPHDLDPAGLMQFDDFPWPSTPGSGDGDGTTRMF